MGRITVPFGIKGWVKLKPFTASPESLLSYSSWWVASGTSWQECQIENAQVQSGFVVAKFAGCADRTAAAAYRGREVAVSRAAFPELAEHEFYWADLIGSKVVNTEGVDFGEVVQVVQTGANDVLVVEGERERLIPFTEEVVKKVELRDCMIRVDWPADF